VDFYKKSEKGVVLFFSLNCILPTFAADLVPGFKAGIKREVRCDSGAIPVAVTIVSGEL
jgi:hypothetical protein